MPTQREAYDFYKKHKSATFKLKAPSGMNTAELNSAISKLVDKKDTPASVRKEWQKLSLKSDAGIGDIEKNIKAVKKKQLKEGTLGKPAQARPEKPKPKPSVTVKVKGKPGQTKVPTSIVKEDMKQNIKAGNFSVKKNSTVKAPKTDNLFDTLSLKELQDILKKGIQPTSFTKKLTPEMISMIKSAIKKKGGKIPETKTKTKKPKITNPNKPITDKEEFLDILSIASQVGKSKGKSSSVEGKVDKSKLKSRVNRLKGNPISFKLFKDILDNEDEDNEIIVNLIDGIQEVQSYNMDYWYSQVSKTAETYDDLTEKQEEKLFNIMAKDTDDERIAYTKNFFEAKFKGKKGLTYEQIAKTIRDDFGDSI